MATSINGLTQGDGINLRNRHCIRAVAYGFTRSGHILFLLLQLSFFTLQVAQVQDIKSHVWQGYLIGLSSKDQGITPPSNQARNARVQVGQSNGSTLGSYQIHQINLTVGRVGSSVCQVPEGWVEFRIQDIAHGLGQLDGGLKGLIVLVVVVGGMVVTKASPSLQKTMWLLTT